MIAALHAELKMIALRYTKFMHILRIKAYRHHAVGRLPVYYDVDDVPVLFWIQATHAAQSTVKRRRQARDLFVHVNVVLPPAPPPPPEPAPPAEPEPAPPRRRTFWRLFTCR